MTERVSAEQILAYAAGDLSGDELQVVANYVASNREAAHSVELFQKITRLAKMDDSQAAPAATLAAARELFAQRRTAAAATLANVAADLFAGLRRIVADLVFDGRPRAALAGIRSGTGERVQLAFESELADIDLQLEIGTTGAAQHWRVMGQVTPRSDAVVRTIVLARHGTFEPIAAAQADAGGMFKLEAPQGRFDVLVSISDSLLVLPDVVVE